ncbi:MAG: LolA-like putative outer membrane lipoprotein chaperone [Weeksellaceae bacterium]
MKKFGLLAIVAFLSSGFLQAQTAIELLNQLSETYMKIPTYYIKFDFKENKNSKPVTGELFAAGEKYNLKIMDIQQMYNGKSLYTITKDDKEVTVSVPDSDSDDFLSPTKVLRMYKSGYNMELGKTAVLDGTNLRYVKLTPIETSEISFAELAINTDNMTLSSYTETLKNGDTREIIVKEFLKNLVIPNAVFKFDKSKYENDGYVVTEL